MNKLKVIHSETLEKLIITKDDSGFNLIKDMGSGLFPRCSVLPDEINGEKYIHTKSGREYLFICEAVFREDSKNYVIYKPLYESKDFPNTLFARSKEMFYENIILDGKEVPRFRKA